MSTREPKTEIEKNILINKHSEYVTFHQQKSCLPNITAVTNYCSNKPDNEICVNIHL